MHSLKISGLLVLMLATLAACSNTFGAAPNLDTQTQAARHINPADDASHAHGW